MPEPLDDNNSPPLDYDPHEDADSELVGSPTEEPPGSEDAPVTVKRGPAPSIEVKVIDLSDSRKLVSISVLISEGISIHTSSNPSRSDLFFSTKDPLSGLVALLRAARAARDLLLDQQAGRA